jgi:hypothetical protein
VPLPVVIAEGPIPLAAERVATPVIRNSHIASAIKGGVLCAIEVSIPIDRYVIATAKLIRIASAINLDIPCPIDREVSISIDRYVIATAKLICVAKTINVRVPCAVHCDVSFTIRIEISAPVNRDVSIAIHREVSVAIDQGISVASCGWCHRRRPGSRGFHRHVTSRTKFLFSLEVSLTHPFVPGEVSLPNRAQSGVAFDHGI